MDLLDESAFRELFLGKNTGSLLERVGQGIVHEGKCFVNKSFVKSEARI